MAREVHNITERGCEPFGWLSEWRTCPTHTVSGLCQLYEQLLPRRVYTSQKAHTRSTEEVQAYWDVPVFAEHRDVRENRVDARTINQKTKKDITLDMSCPWIAKREKKSKENTLKYRPLRWELKQRYPVYECPAI